MNGLKIMIDQLEFVYLNDRKTGRKDVNKLISRPLLIYNFVEKLRLNFARTR